MTLKASRLIITPRRRVFPSGHTSSHDDEVCKSGTYGCINCYLSQDQSEQLCNSFHLIDYLGCVVTRFKFASVNADGKTTPPDRPSGSSLHQLGYTTCTSLHLEIRSWFTSLINEQFGVMAEFAACPAFQLGRPRYDQVSPVSSLLNKRLWHFVFNSGGKQPHPPPRCLSAPAVRDAATFTPKLLWSDSFF